MEKNECIGTATGTAAGVGTGAYIGSVGIAVMGTAIGIPVLGVCAVLGLAGGALGKWLGGLFD